MARDFSARKHRQQQRAKEEINNLFRLAAQSKDQKLANRYAQKARKIGMKFRLPLGSAQKRRICRACGSFLRPGINARVRVRGGKTTYTCLGCRRIQRIPYRRKKRTS